MHKTMPLPGKRRALGAVLSVARFGHYLIASVLTLALTLSVDVEAKPFPREAPRGTGNAHNARIVPSETLVLIDPEVKSWEHLAAGVAPSAEVVVLDGTRDGLAQLTSLLTARTRLEAVHIVSHGRPGGVRLGSTWVGVETLESRIDLLSNWFGEREQRPELLLYGCEVGAGEAGATFVSRLSALTGADVAASDDRTGIQSLGGDWLLERSSGPIEASLAFSPAAMAAYPDVLANIPVTATTDNLTAGDGQCTLREAVINANNDNDSTSGDCPAGTGVDTIVLGPSTYTLSLGGESNEDAAAGGDLDFTDNQTTTIQGAGATIDATGLGERVLQVLSGASFTLEHATVTGGADSFGGGVYNSGTATLISSTVSGNSSTVAGGGIENVSGILTLINTTISGNSASGGGGAIVAVLEGTTTLHNSTVSGNRSTTYGGGIWSIASTISLTNSLVSGNSAPTGPEIHDTGGVVHANAFNVFGHSTYSGTNFAPGANDIVPTGALETVLDPTLAFNGGPTQTHALVTLSPAIDTTANAGGCGVGIETDQRGISRSQPSGGMCDSGAYEFTEKGFDFGDAPTEGPIGAPPDSYPTLLASNGASHLLGGALRLGASVDADIDGQPSAIADGDDTDENHDEDGVIFTSPLIRGGTATVDVEVSAEGKLNAWVDFDADGDWLDSGEQIFSDEPLTSGVNKLSFAVPVGASTSDTFSRFRVNQAGGLAPSGPANDGEVEDYRVSIAWEADLYITKTDSTDPVAADNNFVYTVTVNNSGPSDAGDVVVTENLPAGVTFVSTSGCAEDPAGVPKCTLGTIPPESSTQFTIEVAVDEQTSGIITNVASVDSATDDPNRDNNEAAEDTTVTVAVPTLTQWLTWLLSLSLIGAALIRFRQRRQDA